MIPEFIDRLDKWAIQYKKKRWENCEAALDIINKHGYYLFIQFSFFLAVCTIVLSLGIGTYKFTRADQPIYSSERIGAICNDGWRSFSTGNGTCSHHRGVDHWLYRQIGTHQFNPSGYIATIGSSLSLMIMLSLVSKASRLKFIAGLSEVGYVIGVFIFIILFLTILLTISPILIIKSFFKKKTQGKSNYSDRNDITPETGDDLPF